MMRVQPSFTTLQHRLASLEEMGGLTLVPGALYYIREEGRAFLSRVWPLPLQKRFFLLDGSLDGGGVVVPSVMAEKAFSRSPSSRFALVDQKISECASVEWDVCSHGSGAPLCATDVLLPILHSQWPLWKERIRQLTETLVVSEGASLLSVFEDVALSVLRPRGLVQLSDHTAFLFSFRRSPAAPVALPDLPSIGGYKTQYQFLRQFLFSHRHASLPFPPHGCLLYGPPGVGKTLTVNRLMHDVQSEMDMYFRSVDPGEILSSSSGQSEEILRKIFEETQRSPAALKVLFFDEFDTLFPPKLSTSASSSLNARLVHQLTSLLDSLERDSSLKLIASTNRPNDVDQSLRRGGRFDFEISFPMPTADERLSILQCHLTSVALSPSAVAWLPTLASHLIGYNGSDIGHLCSTARSLASSRSSAVLEEDDFVRAQGSVVPTVQRSFQQSLCSMTWDDIGGYSEVKYRIQQLLDWPRVHKAAFAALGIRPSRGILFYGPPGCAKTTIVKVIASTLKASFFCLTGSEIISPYLGESELFAQARNALPAVIFLDELETLMGVREEGREMENRLLTTLLTEMDGIAAFSNAYLIGATNRREMIDAALLRPGRLEELIHIPLPDAEGCLAILRVHSRNMPLVESFDYSLVSEQCIGLSGAEIENACREAAMAVLRESGVRPMCEGDFLGVLARLRRPLPRASFS